MDERRFQELAEQLGLNKLTMPGPNGHPDPDARAKVVERLAKLVERAPGVRLLLVIHGGDDRDIDLPELEDIYTWATFREQAELVGLHGLSLEGPGGESPSPGSHLSRTQTLQCIAQLRQHSSLSIRPHLDRYTDLTTAELTALERQHYWLICLLERIGELRRYVASVSHTLNHDGENLPSWNVLKGACDKLSPYLAIVATLPKDRSVKISIDLQI